MKHWNGTKGVLKLVAVDVERKHLPLVAAGVAYYFQMSLFPALLLLAAVIAHLPQPGGLDQLRQFLSHVMPLQGVELVESLLATITPHRTALLSFGIITSLWLASVGGKGLILSLDIVYDVHTPRPIWVNRILACVLTLAVGLLLLLADGMTLLGPFLETLLSKMVPVQSLWLSVWPYFQWFTAALFTFVAIELLYLLAPNVHHSGRRTIPGALIAAGTWMALSWGLGIYFQYFGELKLYRFYGILATPVALMIWLYWGAAAILIGGQINNSLHTYRSLTAPDSANLQQRRLDAA